MLVQRIKRNSLFLICLGLIGLTISALIGCSGGGGGSSTPPPVTPPPTPDIHMTSTQILFGDVVLDDVSYETITIENIGSSSLEIYQIAQAHPLSAPFSISNDNCSAKSLAQSETCTLQIRFSPTSQGNFNDSFDIPSNDPDENPVTVSVNGYGRALNLSINQIDKYCPTVNLLITVTDKDGNPILGLNEDNFTLLENGASPTVVGFSDLVTTPLSIALVLDNSNTMVEADAISPMNDASKGFVDLLDIGDEAAICKFAKDIQWKIVFTKIEFETDRDLLKAAIDDPFTGDILGTHLYDAVWEAVDKTASSLNRRAIIAISDGMDGPAAGHSEISIHTLTEVINHAVEKGVAVFTIGLGEVYVEGMQQLANETGGQYFFAPTPGNLSTIFGVILDIFAGQYRIEYTSSSSGGDTINLDVGVDSNNLLGRDSRSVPGCP